MVQLSLPKNSVPVKGKTHSNVELIDDQGQHNTDIRIINIYRWSGIEGQPPQIDRFEIDVAKAGTRGILPRLRCQCPWAPKSR